MITISIIVPCYNEEAVLPITKDLTAQIPGSIYCATLPEVTECLRENAREGDLLMTVGAGDIFKAGQALLGEN